MPGKMDGERRIVSGKIDKTTTAAKMRPKCTMKLAKRRKNTKKRIFFRKYLHNSENCSTFAGFFA
jgi:hypothetical protein